MHYINLFQIKSASNGRCMDLFLDPFIGTYRCYQLGQNQFFAFTKNGQIRTYKEYSCISHSDDNHFIKIQNCNQSDNAQLWHYDKRVSFMIATYSMLLFYSLFLHFIFYRLNKYGILKAACVCEIAIMINAFNWKYVRSRMLNFNGL